MVEPDYMPPTEFHRCSIARLDVPSHAAPQTHAELGQPTPLRQVLHEARILTPRDWEVVVGLREAAFGVVHHIRPNAEALDPVELTGLLDRAIDRACIFEAPVQL